MQNSIHHIGLTPKIKTIAGYTAGSRRRDLAVHFLSAALYLYGMMQMIRLSQLLSLVQETLQEQFAWQRFWVIAEISNHSFYAQRGFHYFDLIESENTAGRRNGSLIAKVSAVAWTAGAMRIKAFEKETGQRFGNQLEVLVEVSVDFHPVYGLKLTLHDIDPRFTLGKLEQQKQATIQKLLTDYPDMVWEEEGQLKSFNQELEPAPVLQRLAILSSASAAGYEDFLHSLNHNSFGYRFELHPFFVTVQGENNARAFAETMEEVAEQARESGLDYDAVVVIRGGGAATDLLLFDQLEVAAAVASCPFPVFTGIGHQKNETITDLVAHTAFKTPTAVAEFIIERNRQFETDLLGFEQQIRQQAKLLLGDHKIALQQAGAGIGYRSQQLIHRQQQFLAEADMRIRTLPAQRLLHEQQELKQFAPRLAMQTRHLIRQREQELAHLRKLFDMASPQKILARGFALVMVDGKISARADQVSTGDNIKIILSATELDATVNKKLPYHGDPFKL